MGREREERAIAHWIESGREKKETVVQEAYEEHLGWEN
jgi:hypothetical protein